VSDGYFRILKRLQPKITVISPNGGEDLKVGKKATIRWEETDIAPGTVTLYYSTDLDRGGWQAIGTVAPGAMQYDWTIPNNVSDRALVRVESGSVGDESDGYFSISFEPIAPIVVTAPNGGEIWTENEWHAITWTGPADISQVQLFYSTDLGSNWNLIGSSSSVAGANSFSWRIPAIVPAANSRALVKIASISDASRFDLSDNPFTLRPSSLGVPGGELATASRLTLLGNYPNPFSSSTELRWIQPVAGDVAIRIYASDGRGVYQMEAGRREAGQQGLIVQKGILSSGVYFYEIRCGNETARGTMSIVH
jgi:hypothetical protein